MSRKKDTDYLSLSARIRAMENRLLTRDRMERMIEAKDHSEAVRVLTECGYPELSGELTGTALESMITQAQAETFQDLSSAVPDQNLIDVFRIKYDYHNAKVLVKAEAVGTDPSRLLMGGGRYQPELLTDAYRKGDLRDYSETFQEAVAKAKDTLAATEDPQLCDFILDRACYAELSAAAQATQSEFVQGYVKLLIDAVNLRCAVRSGRLDKGPDFLNQILLSGGDVDPKTIAITKADDLARLFSSTPLAEAAVLGESVSKPNSGPLTAFERACDDAVTAYVSTAHRVPFGEQPVVGYLYARESELTAIRTIMSGRLAGLDGEIIRERLRIPYAS